MKIKNPETGVEEEVGDVNEYVAKQAKAADEKRIAEVNELTKGFEAKANEGKTAMEKLATEKADLEKKMSDGGQQDGNFKTLKDALDKKTEEIETLKTKMTTAEADRVSTIQKTYLDKKIGSKVDEKVREKIMKAYNEDLKSMPGEKTEDIVKRLDAAIKVSGEAAEFDHLGHAMNGSGGHGMDTNEGKEGKEFTQREKALGSKMGITEEDYKKYSPKLK